MSSLCGINCNDCDMKNDCKGCLETNGHPFGGDCVLAKCCCNKKGNTLNIMNEYKNNLINEFNSLGIEDMPKVKELYSLNGSFVNMEYIINGKKVKLLNDNNIYLGNQLQKVNSNKCYGIVADEEYLLVCEYNEDGLNPNIIIFKKRNY